MKSFEQLGQSAYAAFSKESQKIGVGLAPEVFVTWEELEPEAKAIFIAVAKQLWAEFAAMH